MKHASLETLHALKDLLAELRLMPGLVERKPGIFYRRSQAFLHFHDDPLGWFADVKLNGQAFERFPVTTAQQRAVFAKRVGEALGALA
jgi:hypothetical protein